MKKYRIINRKRFVTALVMAVIMIALSISAVSFGKCKTDYEVCEFTVSEGDTLWGIADVYCDENDDIRNYIRFIMDYNEMESPELMPGDIIVVPYGQ